jgi:hypothetical protein
MASPVARIGAIAGWLSLVGIFGYHLALQGAFGARVSGTPDESLIRAYYRHDAIAVLGVEQFVVTLAVLVFVVALREVLAPVPGSRLWATVGVALVVAEVPLIITEISLQAALVTAASGGAEIVPLFRLWDVLYNSGTYTLEAGLLVAFGLAFRAAPAFPRWLSWLSLVGACVTTVNMLAIWVGIPDPATLVGNLLLGVWFAATSLVLGRLAGAAVPATSPRAAGAGV